MRSRIFAILITLLLASVTVLTRSQAQRFEVLHPLDRRDGANPGGVLIRDAAGNLYGTTEGSGSGNSGSGEGCGGGFKRDKPATRIRSQTGPNSEDKNPHEHALAAAAAWAI
jgi:hypothetical protein